VKLINRLKLVFNEGYFERAVRDFFSGDGPPPESAFDVGGSLALKYNALFGCLRVLAETFISVPFAEFTKGKNGDREITNETGISDLFKYSPNDEMDAGPFKEMGMYQINLGGNFVCVKQRTVGGKILALNPIEWDRISIERDPATKKIVYKPTAPGAKPYERDQVFHVLGPTYNGFVGMSPIEYAAQSIRLGLTYEKFSVNFFKNGVFTTGVFEHPGALKEDAYKRLKKDIEDNWTGLSKSGKPILSEDGMKFKDIAIKLVDAELLASKRFQVEDICRVYRVPLHLVQNLERATFSNIEQQSLEFVMYTMLPWFKRWESAINSQLVTPEQRERGIYTEFNISGLLRGDAASMATAFATGRQWGWLSVNDIRRMLNMNSIGPDGDIYLQPMNMIKAGETPDDPAATLESKKILDEVKKLVESRK